MANAKDSLRSFKRKILSDKNRLFLRWITPMILKRYLKMTFWPFLAPWLLVRRFMPKVSMQYYLATSFAYLLSIATALQSLRMGPMVDD
jgi:hypothetical protein